MLMRQLRPGMLTATSCADTQLCSNAAMAYRPCRLRPSPSHTHHTSVHPSLVTCRASSSSSSSSSTPPPNSTYYSPSPAAAASGFTGTRPPPRSSSDSNNSSAGWRNNGNSTTTSNSTTYGRTQTNSSSSSPFGSTSTSSTSVGNSGWGNGVSGGGSSNPAAGGGSSATARASTAAVMELLQEVVKVTVATGPRGFWRAMQAARSVSALASEYITRGQVDPPQVVLRKLFESLGSTYIKLGQFIASSPSIFPDEYVLEFQKCLDKAEPVAFDVIQKTIEAELGKPWSEVFTRIDPIPLASASVAQVHTAVLRNSNVEVVIKVLKPGVEDVLTTDMSFVYLVSRFLEVVQPELSRLSLAGVISDIRSSVLEEVDFRQEALHIQEFADFLDRSGNRSSATCPYVYRQFSSQRILVMERLRGVPLTDYAAIRSVTRKEPEAVLISALNTWFASVLGAQTFHADVHAGNLLVLADGRVGFIDFGIVGRIAPVTWKAMEALVAALALSDYETMARALATIGACDEAVDYTAFARDLETFFVELESVNTQLVVTRDPTNPVAGGLGAAVEVDQVQVNRLLISLVRIGESHGIRFPREFGLFVKQLLYFDRYTRLLAPSLQVFSDDRINVRTLSRQYGI